MMRALRGAQLLDGHRLLPEPVVVLDRGTIVAAGVAASPGTEVLDLGDVTLLPALVDTPQHLVFDGRGSLEDQVAGRTDAELRDRAWTSARRGHPLSDLDALHHPRLVMSGGRTAVGP